MAARYRTKRRKALWLACRNADGVRGRKLERYRFLSEQGFDICLLHETHPESCRVLRIANYVCHWSDVPTLGEDTAVLPTQRQRPLRCASLGSAARGIHLRPDAGCGWLNISPLLLPVEHTSETKLYPSGVVLAPLRQIFAFDEGWFLAVGRLPQHRTWHQNRIMLYP
jgi:hypothetical protein